MNSATTTQAAVLPPVFQHGSAPFIVTPFLLGIDGPSGDGKTTAQRALADSPPYLPPVPTLITRPPRSDDNAALTRFVSDETFDELTIDPAFLSYSKGSGRAGFNVLHVVQSCFDEAGTLVATDINVIRFVKTAAEAAGLRTFFVYLTATPELRMSRLLAAGYSPEDATARIARDLFAHRPMRARHPIYDAGITNDGSLAKLRGDILAALERAGLVAL